MTSAPPPAPPAEPPAAQPPPPPPPPPPPAWSTRPPLRRSRTDKVIGGVAGGLAEYSGIDALLWRVGFVALAITGGFGVLAYVLLWALMPAGPAAPGDPAAPPAERSRRRSDGPRSPVARITIAALLIVLGVLTLLTRFVGWDIGPRGFLGAALLVVGLGLVAAAFSPGRTARGGLIALGVILSIALIGAASAPWRHLPGGVGDRSYHPATASQVQPVYRGGVGDMTVDLSAVDFSAGDAPVVTRVEHGIGDVTVFVPPEADIEVHVDHGLGDVTAFGESGVSNEVFDGDGTESWSGDGDPEIVLRINAGIGDVEVDRA